jgi:ArsR family transcriptional regulator, arsenate/arsenite/antimonite-responsive transcriptional repressor
MPKRLHDMETVLRALADRTRLRILGLLLTGEVCVCHIHESLKIPQSKASRHLAYLRKARLVAVRRDGLWAHYRLAEMPDAVLQTLQQTVLHVLRHVDDVQRDVERLKKATGCRLPAQDAESFACCGAPSSGPKSRSHGSRAENAV